MNIKIKTDTPALYGFLNNDIPDGAKIVSDPPYETRGFDLNFNVNVNIEITVDLLRITTDLFAIWLYSKLTKIGKNNSVYIDGQKVEIDENKIKGRLLTRK